MTLSDVILMAGNWDLQQSKTNLTLTIEANLYENLHLAAPQLPLLAEISLQRHAPSLIQKRTVTQRYARKNQTMKEVKIRATRACQPNFKKSWQKIMRYPLFVDSSTVNDVYGWSRQFTALLKQAGHSKFLAHSYISRDRLWCINVVCKLMELWWWYYPT